MAESRAVQSCDAAAAGSAARVDAQAERDRCFRASRYLSAGCFDRLSGRRATMLCQAVSSSVRSAARFPCCTRAGLTSVHLARGSWMRNYELGGKLTSCFMPSKIAGFYGSNRAVKHLIQSFMPTKFKFRKSVK